MEAIVRLVFVFIVAALSAIAAAHHEDSAPGEAVGIRCPNPGTYDALPHALDHGAGAFACTNIRTDGYHPHGENLPPEIFALLQTLNILPNPGAHIPGVEIYGVNIDQPSDLGILLVINRSDNTVVYAPHESMVLLPEYAIYGFRGTIPPTLHLSNLESGVTVPPMMQHTMHITITADLGRGVENVNFPLPVRLEESMSYFSMPAPLPPDPPQPVLPPPSPATVTIMSPPVTVTATIMVQAEPETITIMSPPATVTATITVQAEAETITITSSPVTVTATIMVQAEPETITIMSPPLTVTATIMAEPPPPLTVTATVTAEAETITIMPPPRILTSTLTVTAAFMQTLTMTVAATITIGGEVITVRTASTIVINAAQTGGGGGGGSEGGETGGNLNLQTLPSSDSSTNSGAVAFGVASAMAFAAALYYGGPSAFQFSPDFGYAITENGYSYNYGARLNFSKENWRAYWTAGQTNANGDVGEFRYAAVGEYRGDFWRAFFSEYAQGGVANYNFGLSADFQNGIWKLSPTYRFHSRLDWEKKESESRNSLDLQGVLQLNRWTIHPSAGFNWRRMREFGDTANFHLQAVRQF